MAPADRTWTIHWNEKARQFFARFRIFPLPEFGSDEPAWGTKRIPKEYARHQLLDAERWMIAWYSAYLGSGGINVSTPKITPVTKTLRLLGPRWLKYRYDDRGTKINTYKGHKQALNNWILDNGRFEHVSIETLDMEREFTAEVCLAWMNSIKREDSTVLAHTLALSTLFNDCIALAWLDPDLPNPLARPVIKKTIGKLIEASKRDHVVTFLSLDQVVALLTEPTRKVADFRRVRYVLVLGTGLRDHEVQGLVWIDFHLDDPIPYVYVDRQLDKIGTKPFVQADDLARAGRTKDEILAITNALVSPPKRNSRRAIPLLPIVVLVLKWWRALGWKLYVGQTPKKDDPVFPSGKANRHSPPGQFAFVESPELLRKDLERVGQPVTFKDIDLDFQALRRTFATLLNMNGVSEAEVGDLLGHGAKSTARGHYISPELLGRRLELLRRLPLPDRMQLQGRIIEIPPGERGAEIIRLPVGRSRA
jgi:integrase